jgi:hypothetical protein
MSILLFFSTSLESKRNRRSPICVLLSVRPPLYAAYAALA